MDCEQSNTQDGSDALLADLSSDEPARRDRAARQLRQILDKHARSELGGRADRVNVQIESVVQSVLVGELDQIQDRCADDRHAVHYLRRAIRNKIIDRLRKGGHQGEPMQHSQLDPEGESPGAALAQDGSQPGPGTQLSNLEQQQRDQNGFEQLRQRLIEGLSSSDRALVEQYVLNGAGWEAAASAAGLQPATARQRLSRRRQVLLSAAIEPLRSQVDGEDWILLEGLLVRRRSLEKLATVLGRDVEVLERRYAQLQDDMLMPLLGTFGCDALIRLMGK